MRIFTINQSDIARCPRLSLAVEHYRNDGTCLCRPAKCSGCNGHGEVVVDSHALGDGCFNDDFDTCPHCGGTGREPT